jgi:hypothetical protein
MFLWKHTGENNEMIYRAHLILEELAEMCIGLSDGDEHQAADGIGDLLYVVVGSGVAFKLPCHELSEEVCSSNATKQPRTAANYRLRDKGKNYVPPDFEKALRIGKERIEEDYLSVEKMNVFNN